MKPALSGQPYRFGPFQLTLPQGWTAEVIDGVHQLEPLGQDFAVHLSGYEQAEALTPEALRAAARQLFDAEGTPVTLPSGLPGLTLDKADEEGDLRYWLFHAGRAMVVVTLSCPADTLARHAVAAQMLIATLQPAET